MLLLSALFGCSFVADKLKDADGDGYAADVDCDDDDAAVHPDATEVCDLADVDEDCDGKADSADPELTDGIVVYHDADGDGFGETGSDTVACEVVAGYATATGDCDDADAAINPGAAEICDGQDVDEDCDGLADDADDSVATGGMIAAWPDTDGDGYGDAAGEALRCDLADGWVDDATDCDDTSGTVSPVATEICDDVDDDCDGDVDENDAADAGTWYLDDDGDGYGDAATSRVACDAPDGWLADGSDCDDLLANVNPGADEYCDGYDDDCDGDVDEDAALDVATWYRDGDGDGYGDPAASTPDCDQPSGYVDAGTDCDDGDAGVNPGATEACDGADTDEDCDGLADDDDSAATGKTTWYVDADGDTYGDVAHTASACDAPAGYVADATDCDDATAARNPGNVEVCDAADLDEDCDGLADNDDTSATGTTRFYEDGDGDAYGNPASSVSLCDLPAGYVADATDCDDRDATVSTAGAEVCDAADTDEDCDGLADDADGSATGQTTWYADADGDDYGDETISVALCDAPAGYVDFPEDCDDGDAAINPGVDEVCDDAVDDNCDGITSCDFDFLEADADRVLVGEDVGDQVGADIAGVGDVDGDGIDDILVGAADAEYAGGTDRGVVYVVSGGVAGTTDLSAADAGFYGAADDDGLGAYISDVGDVNADGYADVAFTGFGADTAGTNFGAAYVAFGPLTGFAAASSADVALMGTATYDVAGLGGGGDVDGDGAPDLVIGSIYRGASYTGGASLVTGISAGTSSLSAAEATFTGEHTGDQAGRAVDILGDTDGDGLADLAVAAIGVSSGAGAVYVFEGPVSGTVSLASADAKWTGSAAGVTLGTDVCGGDVDGDGYADLVAGAQSFSGSKVFLFSGPFSGTGTTASADATVSNSGYYFGATVACDGDVDGDGYADVLAGSQQDNTGGSMAGAAWLFLGPMHGSYVVGDALGSFTGSSRHYLGADVAFVGAQDGSGGDEVLVGATGVSDGGTSAGAVYLFDPI